MWRVGLIQREKTVCGEEGAIKVRKENKVRAESNESDRRECVQRQCDESERGEREWEE